MASGLPSNPLKKIRLNRISHVYYKHQKYEEAKQFAEDFGFVEAAVVGKTTYYRGYGTEPFVLAIEQSDVTEFGGAAFTVDSEEDLTHASKILPKECKATAVHDIPDAPGGGKRVTFYDPVDGFPFHLVYGQTPVELRDPQFPTLKINYVRCPFSQTAGTAVCIADTQAAKREESRPKQLPALQEATGPCA